MRSFANFLRAVSWGYCWRHPRSLHPLKMTSQRSLLTKRAVGLHENSLGGVGVVEAPIADMSLADGLFWPPPSSGICTTGAMGWRGGRAGIPSFLAVSIVSAMVWGCVFCDGRSYSRRVYGKYGTTIWGQKSEIFSQTSGEK